MSRQKARPKKSSAVQGDAALRDVTGYIENNPITSAVIALAAGVIATSVFKMTVGKTNGAVQEVAAPAAAKPKPKARAKTKTRTRKKPAVRKKTRAKSRSAQSAKRG